MRHSQLRFVVPLALSALSVRADVVYVTDLEIFTYLAPCAASAISYNIQSQTYDRCPEGVTALQGCVCTQDNNFNSIKSALSSSVSYSCGATASEDQASAQTVLSAYCNQDDLPTFPTPTSPVSAYITDIPEFDYLAPCAASGLSYAVQSLTYSLCPPDAKLLATCACGKNENSLVVSQAINTEVKMSCSSHSEDITSAQAMFSAYCAMNNGTTSFPTPTSPPGDMTYYITALTQYSALAPCASYAVSEVLDYQTYNYCPGGVEALASCACIKESISGSISSSITASVKWSCDSTATADISSALAVFDFYCSAAKGLVEAAGVTESESQTRPTGTGVFASETGASATRGSNSPSSTSTGGSGGSGSGSGSGSNGNGNGSGGNSGDDSGSKSNTAVIAGAVVGVVGGLALIGAAVWFIMRHRRNARNNIAQSVQSNPPNDPAYPGKPELAGTVLAAPPSSQSPNPSMHKYGGPSPVPSPRPDTISPISGGNSPYPPPPHQAELQGHAPAPFPPSNTSELQGQNAYPMQPTYAGSHPQYPGAQEAYSQPVYEVPGQQQRPVYQADSTPIHPPRAELQGMGYQSGPVQDYHEMDGSGYGQAR